MTEELCKLAIAMKIAVPLTHKSYQWDVYKSRTELNRLLNLEEPSLEDLIKVEYHKKRLKLLHELTGYIE